MKDTFSVREISNQFKIPKKTILGYCLRNKLVPEYHNKHGIKKHKKINNIP